MTASLPIRTHYAALTAAALRLHDEEGLTVLGVAAETQLGIVPLVGLDAEAKTLVFFDVQVADEDQPHSPPIGARDPAASRRLRRAGAAWINGLNGTGPEFREVRWDALGVRVDQLGGLISLEHVHEAR